LFSCADISIGSNDDNLLIPSFTITTTTTTTTQDPLFLFPFFDSLGFPPSDEPSPPFIFPITDVTTTTTTTTLAMNIIYPFRSPEHSIDQLNKNTNKALRCYPTHEALKPLIGIENWCLQLCATHCPPALCICVNI
jgi:hypothetical protein